MNKSVSLVWVVFCLLTVFPTLVSGQSSQLRQDVQTSARQQGTGNWASRPFPNQLNDNPGYSNYAPSLDPSLSIGDLASFPNQEQLPPVSADTPESNYQPPEYDPDEFGEYFSNATQRRVRGCIEFDSCLTRELLDFQNRQTDKPVTLMKHSPGECYPKLIIGGQMRASFLAASTNTANKFSYLGRFPPDFVGSSATDARLSHANMSATAHFSKFANGQVELLFSDVFSFPTFKQGSLQVRQAYVTIGDLDTSPFYAFIGKHNVSFGDMRTLSPFSQSVVWHYFGGLAEGVGAGVNSGNWNWTATAINGGRGIRVVDSQAIGQLNNFAANASWQLPLGCCNSLQLGGGYLHGTIYDAATAEHTNTALFGKRNPAWDVNAHLNVGLWQFSGEFVSTINPWPVTGHEVAAWRGETAREVCVFGLPGRLSASFSEGIQGDRGTEFEFNRQLVLGLGVYPTINTQVTFEYVQSTGFAPLIDITTVSDRDVIQNSFVMGLVFVL